MSTDIHTLSGAYALDALDADERARFERHLAGCASCRIEVNSLRETAAALGESTAVTPPPALRESVLAGIQHIRPAPPLIGPRPPRRVGWMPALLVAASLALGLAAWQPWAPQQPSQAALVSAVIHASDAQNYPQALPDGGSVTWYRSARQAQVAVVVNRLPEAPAGKAYELWLQQPDGQMHPAGLLTKPGDSSVVLSGAGATASAAGITIEPAGGSATPTTAPLALVSF